MQTEFPKPFAAKTILAGVFSGFIVTIVDLIYNAVYREVGHYSSTLLINISSIIFSTMLLSLIIGLLFFGLVKYLKKGRMIFSIFILLVTIVCVTLTMKFRMQSGSQSGYDGLFCGLQLITGLSLAFLVPYFGRHSDLII